MTGGKNQKQFGLHGFYIPGSACYFDGIAHMLGILGFQIDLATLS